jgi:hypothetical protein
VRETLLDMAALYEDLARHARGLPVKETRSEPTALTLWDFPADS